jgi:hypothetical protein
MGSRHAADIEENSVFVLVADFLVGNGIRRAPTLGLRRLGDVHGLHRRPFGFPQTHHHAAEGDVCFCVCVSTGTVSDQATPSSLRSVCSPPSLCLTI